MVPLNTAREWGAYLPNARVEIFKGPGHLVWLDAPQKLNRKLRRFLNDRWPRGAKKNQSIASRFTSALQR